jgi:signal transduction histidine kinase/CheY-like chemotaxis protein
VSVPASLDDRILLAAPLGRDAEVMTAFMARSGLEAIAFDTADALAAAIGAGVGVIVITEEVVIPTVPLALADALHAQPAWSDVPVIVLTSADRVAEPSAVAMRAFDMLGNITLLERPVRMMTLLSTVRSALRARRRQYEVREYVTERRQLEDALRERAEALESAGRAKDEFLAMLGHELRNPLGAIIVAARILERSELSARQGAQPREVIMRQAKHLTRLVDDLLDVSRVTLGKVALHRKAIDVADAVTRCMAALQTALHAGEHEIVVETQPVWAMADETRLDQIVGNLVSNALKYTPAGGRVAVRVVPDSDSAVISVQDTGIGVEPSLLPRVFDLFVQGEERLERSRGGLGIGLTLVRRLVELHGGTVAAVSDGPGRGTTFVVRLPRVEAPHDGASPSSAVTSTPPPLQVLIVEDNEDARDMMRHLFLLAGHAVRDTGDGPAGLAMALERPPDVAIIDIGLPGLDGFELARRLRADQRGRGVTLVALTGYGHSETRARALDAGFDVFLVKPLAADDLQQILTSVR